MPQKVLPMLNRYFRFNEVLAVDGAFVLEGWLFSVGSFAESIFAGRAQLVLDVWELALSNGRFLIVLRRQN